MYEIIEKMKENILIYEGEYSVLIMENRLFKKGSMPFKDN
jgi:hypothetical protein